MEAQASRTSTRTLPKLVTVGRESLHFHELIHIVQWRVLGPEGFLAMHADGLTHFGYPTPAERRHGT